MIIRAWILAYHRYTGLPWSPSMGAIGIAPTLRWVLTGNLRDLRIVKYPVRQ